MAEPTLADVMKALNAINARLDEHDQSIGTLVQEKQGTPSPKAIRNHKETEIKLNELPEFDGDKDPDAMHELCS